MTSEGLEKLKSELEELKNIERPSVIKAIAQAREHGDLSENAEYHAAREKQSFIEGKINELENKISRAEVIDLTKLDGKRVTFGTKVTVYDEDADKDVEFSIVGPYEANLEKGLISVSSPLAKILSSKRYNANVSIIHSRTTNQKLFTKEADIFISAIGSAKMYDSTYFKNGATIIDIGISSVDGKTYGDIDTLEIGEVISSRAPFPGGVGPITVSALFFNLSRLIQTN